MTGFFGVSRKVNHEVYFWRFVASLEAGRDGTFRGGRPRGKMVLYGGAIDGVVIRLQIKATQVML